MHRLGLIGMDDDEDEIEQDELIIEDLEADEEEKADNNISWRQYNDNINIDDLEDNDQIYINIQNT